MTTENLDTAFNFARIREHPLAQNGYVEMLPTEWVAGLANPGAGNTTTLEPFEGPVITLDALWDDLKQNGLREPFILAVSYRDGACRLESGNHRIQVFSAHGVLYVPATVRMAERAIIDERNGTHSFTRPLVFETVGPSNRPGCYPHDPRYYKAPSEVFEEIRRLKNAEKISQLRNWVPENEGSDPSHKRDWIAEFTRSVQRPGRLPPGQPSPPARKIVNHRVIPLKNPRI